MCCVHACVLCVHLCCVQELATLLTEFEEIVPWELLTQLALMPSAPVLDCVCETPMNSFLMTVMTTAMKE